jgi:hypothetical protein
MSTPRAIAGCAVAVAESSSREPSEGKSTGNEEYATRVDFADDDQSGKAATPPM